MRGRTTVNGTLQLTTQNQDETLIPWTINPLISSPAVIAAFPRLAQLPRATAQAEARGVNTLLSLSSRPSRLVNVSVRYRFNERDVRTPAFDATDTVNVYASYATGYKASSIALSRDSKPLASDFAALSAAGRLPPNQIPGTRFAGPENSTVYELGLKGNWGVATYGFSFLLGWMIKATVVNVGGARAYHNLIPLMCGLIAGGLASAALWLAVGLTYFVTTGLTPPSYNVFGQ